MDHSDFDTEELVRQAAGGDDSAVQCLLTRHRSRLKGMVGIRMDKRLASRIDASDIVQETLREAARQIPDYLRDPVVPFYPWIRQLAWQQLIRQHRRHVSAQARSVRREEQQVVPLPDHSTMELAVRLVAKSSGPLDQLLRRELRSKVQAVLAKLGEGDREVLVLRFLEQLSIKETAAVLELTVDGTKSRQSRALEKFSRLFGDASGGPAH